jgi:cell division septum initiation protein DivIVA
LQVSDRGIYHPCVDEADGPRAFSAGERTELLREIERLEADLARYEETEEQLVRTLVSATTHAAAIRESARREAELMLRKASAEVERRKAAADRERGELLRLRRITEQTRQGLAGLLTAKLEELQLDVEDEPPLAQHEAELAEALDSGLERNLERVASEPASAIPEPQPRDQHEQGPTGVSADASP